MPRWCCSFRASPIGGWTPSTALRRSNRRRTADLSQPNRRTAQLWKDTNMVAVSGMYDPVDNVLSRLEKVKQAGRGWVARCPAHDDRNPSLSITVGRDAQVLLYCHAG